MPTLNFESKSNYEQESLKNYSTPQKVLFEITEHPNGIKCNIENLKNINYVVNRGLQTLTYFGFSKKFLQTFFETNNFNGIDRVVPFGQALNINLIWDGYDLTKILSREIEIR